MSKNITIQEGGVAKIMTVDKIKTNLAGGGTCLWIPEDGTQLGTKYITDNGAYKASDDGYYGYSEVTVNGVGQVSGKAPDGSGDEAVAKVDETGTIAITKVPSYIEIVTQPNQTTYKGSGQSVSTLGMVVKACYASGEVYKAAIPLSELSITPDVTQYDESTAYYELVGEGISWRGNVGVTQYRYGSSPRVCFGGVYGTTTPPESIDDNIKQKYPLILSSSGEGEIVYLTEYENVVWGVKTGAPITVGCTLEGGSSAQITISNTPMPKASSTQISTTLYDCLSHYALLSTRNPGDVALEDLERINKSSRQTITVMWARPEDGKILETTFTIIVEEGVDRV